MKKHDRLRLAFVFYAFGAILMEMAAYPQALVIQGGTLIDGNGGPPVRDALILIEGDRFRTVTTVGKAPIPPGAKVIPAEGKYILPGLVDSHFHLADWHFELALAHGETTIIDTGNVLEWTLLQKEGIAKGKIRGPRLFVSNTLVAAPDHDLYNLTARRQGLWGVEMNASRKAEENVTTARGWIAQGIDVLKFHPVPLEVVRVMAGEARRRGIPTMCHCDLNALETVPLGIRKLAHASGIVEAVINDPARFAQIKEMRLPELAHEYDWDWSFVEPETYGKRMDEVIQFLVKNQVYVEPTIESEWKGVYPESPEFVAYDMQFLHNHPALLNYVPPVSQFYIGDYNQWIEGEPGKIRESLERIQKAYRNFQYFIRRFVELGGKVHVSSDQTHDSIAGVSLHNEMILTQSAGLTPMQIIVAATRNPAEWLGKLNELGTIEPGKLADLILVTKDPLSDIRNLKGNVETVIIGGKVMDITYHADYHNPIPGIHNVLKYPNVAPELDPKVVPRVVVEGSEAVPVTIRGRGFHRTGQAYFKNVPVPTRVKDSTTMEITIPPELLTQVGAWPITAINPPPNEGPSKAVYLWIKFR